MASAPDAGAGWGSDREAAFQAWEATQNFEKNVDEEFSFAPNIINVKGVTSTMSDYGAGWAEKREIHLRDSRSQRQLLEREELPFQPELLAKATNETILKGSGYVGPIQGWRQQAERFRRAGESKPVAPAEVADDSKKSGRQKSWGPVVQRLYPFSAHVEKDSKISVDLPGSKGSAVSVAASSAAASPARVEKEAGGDASAGGSAGHKFAGRLEASPADTDLSTLTPGKPGRRRYGRPPKATWEYLYESGTRHQRGKSMPPQAEQHQTPRPLKRSEQLLQKESCTRRPLHERPNHLPEPPSPSSTCTTTATGSRTQGEQRPRSVGASSSSARAASAGHRLFEQSERLHARREQKKLLAGELKVAQEMRECTFRPQTNCDRRAAVRSSSAEKYSSRAPGAGLDESTLSLYERGIRAKQRREHRVEQGKLQSAEAELRECTFTPSIQRVGQIFPEDERPALCLHSASVSGLERSPDDSYRDMGCSPASQQASEVVTSTVLTMLDDWREQAQAHNSSPSRARSDGRGQAVHNSPPSWTPDDGRGQAMHYSQSPASAAGVDWREHAQAPDAAWGGQPMPHPAAHAQDEWMAQGMPYHSSSQAPEDWRGQAMHYSPPSRSSDQHLSHEPMQQEPDNGMLDRQFAPHSQRHEAVASDVQALLHDWRGSWGGIGEGSSKPLTPLSPSHGGELTPSSRTPPPMLEATGGAEVNVFDMLQHWRAGQNAGIP